MLNPNKTAAISAIELAKLEMLGIAQSRHERFFRRLPTNDSNTKTIISEPTNPFPGLCLSNSGDCEARADKIKLSIEINDPELAFVFKRHAEYDGVSIQEYCKRSLLQVLENEEAQFERDVDPATGLIVIK